MTARIIACTRLCLLQLCLCLTTLYSSTTLAGQEAETSPDILVSILPLQALVAGVMQGVAQPGLLLDSGQSPHHASLRPSQMRAIRQADVLFWIGPQLETFLPRVLGGSGANVNAIALLANPQLRTLALRSADHEHTAGTGSGASTIDPHIWLSSHNVAIMIDQIAQQLIALDPAHAARYRRNQATMRDKIKALQQQLSQQFKAGTRYISYHDGYQYLEQEFGLQLAGSISQNDEMQPGIRHLHELRRVLQQQAVHCVVYDAPVRPALVDSLLQGSSAHAVELDALGLRLPTQQRDWFTLMQRLASNFSECLKPAKPTEIN